MRALIIEDDKQLRESLHSALAAECFAVDDASDGERGSFLARTNDYDVVLLDYMLPKQDGMTVCKAIREAKKTPYVMMLSVKNEAPLKVELLNLGADDYLPKPFSNEELIARIRALLRRPRGLVSEVLSYADVTLDTRSHIVARAGREIYLTRKEYMLLEYLLRHKGEVVTRSMLGEHVWDSNLNVFSNTIESHILTLRKKLLDTSKSGLIHTVPGRGYRIGGSSATHSV